MARWLGSRRGYCFPHEVDGVLDVGVGHARNYRGYRLSARWRGQGRWRDWVAYLVGHLRPPRAGCKGLYLCIFGSEDSRWML